MSATMKPSTLSVLLFIVGLIEVNGTYKLSDIEIKTNPGGEPLKIFTAEELAQFDASDVELPIYLGIRGVVFDVTTGKDFYNKESDYNVLVGKDATRGHALWSLDEKDLTHDLSGLTDAQLKGVDEVFKGTYMTKYPVVGYMDWFITEQQDNIKKRFSNDEL